MGMGMGSDQNGHAEAKHGTSDVNEHPIVLSSMTCFAMCRG